MTGDTNPSVPIDSGATSGQPEGFRPATGYPHRPHLCFSEHLRLAHQSAIADIDDLTGPWHLAAPCPADCPTVTMLLAGCEVDIHEGTYPNGDTDGTAV